MSTDDQNDSNRGDKRCVVIRHVHCGELRGHGGGDLVRAIRRDTASFADALVPRCRAMLTAWLLAEIS